MENNKTDGKYIASLVLGICSLTFGALIIPIIGLILSIKSKKELEAKNETNGMVTAGLVLNIIGLVKGGFTLIGVIIWVMIIIFSVIGETSYSSYSTKKPSSSYRSSSYYSYY
ncbi:MAG: hypothetical protein J6M60_02815 [Clostridia bacterium]|nr:hypothetical protein [Clostridia bacterium]